MTYSDRLRNKGYTAQKVKEDGRTFYKAYSNINGRQVCIARFHSLGEACETLGC